MGLKLKLRAGECLFLSGALIRNGNTNTEIEILNKVAILREKDLMLEAEAITPCQKVYFALQTLYLQPGSEVELYAVLSRLLLEVMKAAPSTSILLEQIHDKVTVKSYFEALKLAKELIDYESTLTEHAKAAK